MSPRTFRGAWAFLLLAWLGWPGAAWPESSVQTNAQAKLEVTFFDVGQGDAALIRSPTGKTILIDGGPPEAGERLARKVNEMVEGPLDLVILTHPHLDHLGGLGKVLRQVGTRAYMDPGTNHPSKAYAELLTLIGQRVGKVIVPQPTSERPLTIGLGGGATLEVLWPRAPLEPFLQNTRSDANANSLVTRLVFGKTAMLFVGDAEADTESKLLRSDLKANLLKVAHHGSRHSSRDEFLKAVNPENAVISCAARNDYGHPGAETLERLSRIGARVFRTDQLGDVFATSDGSSVRVRPSRGAVATVEDTSASAPTMLGSDNSASAEANRAEPGPVPSASGGPARTAPAPWPHRDEAPDALARSATSARSTVATSVPPYVASKSSQVFHKASCSAAQKLKPENRVPYSTRDDAERERRPAKDCNP